MARLKGLGSFLLVTTAVFLVLRLIHVAVPLFFPETSPGPFPLASVEEVGPRLGFAPYVPAYRPLTLGERPPTLTGVRAPRPTVVIVWRGERYLVLTQRRGGARPEQPPTSVPLAGVPDSAWWSDGGRRHLVLRREELWITLETDLSAQELRRVADTLGPYRGRVTGPPPQ